MIRDNHLVRLLFKSVLAGFGVAVAFLLLSQWPVDDSQDELRLAAALMIAPFPLSLLGALLARLPHWPVAGLLAPFAMLVILHFQPAYDAWIPDERLAFVFLLGVPVVAGFTLTALVCALAFRESTPENAARLQA
ncbi:hypothetical protein ACIBEJ_39675 [Nonomuraea sp. NPDC050790]|uniref:hypothetical protein n=1 Tax=Nonomuraea sp. NPDC050790 TaxID=3364371 RepID=UPI0037B8E656